MELSEIVKKTKEKVQMVIEGYSSQYFNFTWNDETWTVRVSDHRANPLRANENTISFVIELPESEQDEKWSIRKKSFKSISNQFFLDSDGEFYENFRDMEECIDYILN